LHCVVNANSAIDKDIPLNTLRRDISLSRIKSQKSTRKILRKKKTKLLPFIIYDEFNIILDDRSIRSIRSNREKAEKGKNH